MRTACNSSHLQGWGCLPQCMLEYTPQVWAWRPPWVWAWRLPRCRPGDPLGVGLEIPWVWAWRPPRPDTSTSPLGVGLETPPGQTPQLPPWVLAWRPARHAGIPPAMHVGIPPLPSPREQNSWQMLLKILPCPKLRLWAVITRNKNSLLTI